MNLAIDIGNSFVKIGEFDNGELISPIRRIRIEEVNALIPKINPEKIVLSSVADNINDTTFPFITRYPSLILNHQTPLPFNLDYETPQTLGVDRIAAAAGAQVKNPERTSMVIDVGTCITYDLVDKKTFYGGMITPGLTLRFRSMHDYTGNLPWIEFNQSMMDETIIGKSTSDAMKSGVVNGIIAEMDSFIAAYRKFFPDLQVIMCGGETKIFESKLKASIFAVPELVLIGLNRILDFNG